MTLEEAMQEIFYHGFVFTLHPKKCLEALKVIRKSLIDYKEIKDDYADLDNRLRTANTENDELKRMLRLAVDDFQTAMLEEKCKVCGFRTLDSTAAQLHGLPATLSAKTHCYGSKPQTRKDMQGCLNDSRNLER